MESPRSRFRAPILLPLMALSQVPTVWAFPPLRQPYQNISFVPEEPATPVLRPQETSIASPDGGPDLSTIRSEPTGETASDWHTTYTIHQIGDGQIQAPAFSQGLVEPTSSWSTATNWQQPPGPPWPSDYSSTDSSWSSESWTWTWTTLVETATSTLDAVFTSATSSTAPPTITPTASTSSTSSSFPFFPNTSLSSTTHDQSPVVVQTTSTVSATDTSIVIVPSIMTLIPSSTAPASSSGSVAPSPPVLSTVSTSTAAVESLTTIGVATSSASSAVETPSVAILPAVSADLCSSDSPLTADKDTTTSIAILETTSAVTASSEFTSIVTSETTVTRFVTTTVPNSELTTLTTSAVQSASQLPTPNSESPGIVHTSLETSGEPSEQPFPTHVTTASTILSLVDTSTVTRSKPTPSTQTSLDVKDIFQPIATDSPPAQISQVSDHPVPRLGIEPQQRKIPTNKFYANFFLGAQDQPTWTHPYSVFWAKGGGSTQSWGMGIAHVERSQLATGPPSYDTGAWEFFASPLGIQYLIMSAAELVDGATLTTDTLDAFSVNVNLAPSESSKPVITFPIVQGMGFVTGSYRDATPLIQSGVGILDLTYGGTVDQGHTVHKYRAQLQDTSVWLMYVTPRNSTYSTNSFTLLNSQNVQGPTGFTGHIQIAKLPSTATDAESIYDSSAGVYATGVTISGSVEGTTGSYTLTRSKGGLRRRQLLMFALPHHMQSLSNDTTQRVTDVQLITTTKGMATAIRGDSWTLVEPDLPISMGFAPWRPTEGSIRAVSADATVAIQSAGTSELGQDMSDQTDVNSVYYAGKALAKFAGIIYALHDIVGNRSLALTGLQQLKFNFAQWVNNTQQFPLYYESAWGGSVSSASYSTGDAGVDFGNTYYNDHHFHYGYFVYTAAVIAYLDPDWLDEGTNKAWVNMLVRDYGNSISDDPYYPFSRMFDWYHGHSWAEGLFESADGKNEESSSEDTMASYAIKMWGHVIGDKNMEARGNLMLGVQARSLSNYFLYLSDNTVEPAEFIGNKVSGILFENKIDHTTYFGTNIEYIEGIHMLPQLPLSTYTRSREFVQQEWDTYFSTYVNQVQGGWRGILMADYAIIDPVASYQFFSNATGDFNVDYLDGGASQTWYLAWSAALGGSPAFTKKERSGADEGQVEDILTMEQGSKVSAKVRDTASAYDLIDDTRRHITRKSTTGRSGSPRPRQRVRGRGKRTDQAEA